ncbi:MAG: amidohydrolase family protein [Myxococcales bacterium]|nr:amidohydrolase family protein [Myxococcales bacterium]
MASFCRALIVFVATLACTTTGERRRPDDDAHRYDGPVIDVHTHVFFDGQSGGLPGLDGSPAGVLAAAEAPRVARVGVIVMAPRPGIAATRALNDRLAAFVQTTPTRLFGIGTVHPADGADAIAELSRFPALGIRMLKLHPNTQGFDLASPEVNAVVAAAGQVGLPVLLDFSGLFQAQDLGKYLMLAVKNPKSKLILAHMGGTRFHELLVLTALREHGSYANNVWVDLSAVAHLYADSPYRDQLVHVIRRLGTDRVLFASDFPFDRTPAQAMADVHALGLTAAEERQIFHDNAAALLGFDSGETP